MVCDPINAGSINVLVSEGGASWHVALRDLFEPRGVNMLVAQKTADVIEMLQNVRVHTALIDFDSSAMSGLGAVRIVHAHNPLLPCILLAESIEQMVLEKALAMDVFSVIAKPVDEQVLLRQLDRLFMRHYNCNVFA